MTERAGSHPGCDYQVIERDLANTHPWLRHVDRPRVQVNPDDFAKHHADILLTFGKLPERGSDLGWSQNRRRDLVQEGLEDVVVAAVDQHNVRIGAL
jgi:hypothetical protein